MKQSDSKKPKQDFSSLGSLFHDFQMDDKGGYITQEFQDFGYRLALDLNDMAHKSLYMRLAKKEPRIMLERALSFVKDAETAKSKARLFMWKLAQLRQERSTKWSLVQLRLLFY